EALDEVRARVRVGGPGPFRHRPTGQILPREHPLRHRRPDDLRDPELLRRGDDLALDHPPQHRILGLVRDELDAQLRRQGMTGSQLLRRPLRDADVEGLALSNDVGEGLEGLLQRRLVVVPMRLVEIDVVGAEATEGAVDRLHDVLATEAGVVRSLGAGGEVDLGEDLQALAALAGEGFAEDDLRGRVGIGVCGVERGDPGVESGVHGAD
ncbi:hypothetical protein ABE10_01405, partial [Bacillus toyonensis]|nr:hypothetical protein [Bacillus toyonensis]